MDGRPPRPWQDRPGLETLLAFAAMAVALSVGGDGKHAVDSVPAAVAKAAARQPAALHDLAADPPIIEPASWIGGPITSLAPAGDLVWLAQGRRVWAVDLADPDGTRDLGPGLRFEGEVDALAVDGSLGLAAVGSELWALNLADARAPRRSGRLSLLRPPGDGDAVKVERILLYGRIAVIRQAHRPDDLFVDLQRPATPLVLTSSPVNLPGGSMIEAFQSVGDVVVVAALVPQAGSTLFLFDRRKPLTARPLGRMAPAPRWWAVRDNDGAERLVGMEPGGAGDAYLTLTTWDLSSPSAPRVLERQAVPSPISEDCSIPTDLPAFTSDGGLYVACDTRFGSFYWVGALLRWRPVDPESGTPWSTVMRTNFPFDRQPIAFRERLFAVSSQGVHVYHSPLQVEVRHPVVTSTFDLVADRVAGRPTLLVNAGYLHQLDLGLPLDPVLRDAFGWGLSTHVTYDAGMAVTDSVGALDIHTVSAKVADLTDPNAIDDAGSIDLNNTGSENVRMAQGERTLSVITRDARADLYRLDPDAPPHKVGTVAAPGGTLVTIAMHDDLLVTLSLERPSDRDITTPLTVTLFRIQDLGDTVQVALVAHRTLTEEAWGNPHAVSLVITADWLVVSLGLGCGQGREHGVMMLRLEPGRDEASLNRYLWIPHTGNALLVHDGFLFVEEPGWISALDIRQVAERPWAWREAARLQVTSPRAMTALGRTVYVSTGSSGVAIFQPDLPWASDPAAPTPTAPPNPPPFTPTQPSTPCLSPTPTATASATASPSRTPAATGTARESATPTRAPGQRLWLPLVGAG